MFGGPDCSIDRTSAKAIKMKPSTDPTEDGARERAHELCERSHRLEGYEMEF